MQQICEILGSTLNIFRLDHLDLEYLICNLLKQTMILDRLHMSAKCISLHYLDFCTISPFLMQSSVKSFDCFKTDCYLCNGAEMLWKKKEKSVFIYCPQKLHTLSYLSVSFYIIYSTASATDKLSTDTNIALKGVSLTFLTVTCVPGEDGNCMEGVPQKGKALHFWSECASCVYYKTEECTL